MHFCVLLLALGYLLHKLSRIKLDSLLLLRNFAWRALSSLLTGQSIFQVLSLAMMQVYFFQSLTCLLAAQWHSSLTAWEVMLKGNPSCNQASNNCFPRSKSQVFLSVLAPRLWLELLFWLFIHFSFCLNFVLVFRHLESFQLLWLVFLLCEICKVSSLSLGKSSRNLDDSTYCAVCHWCVWIHCSIFT